MLRVMMPAPPAPLRMRPAMKGVKERAWPVRRPPAAKRREEDTMQERGVKSWERRPMRGARLAMEIWVVSAWPLSAWRGVDDGLGRRR